MRGLLPEVRRLIVDCRRKGKRVKEVCEVFQVSSFTVWKWCARAFHRGYESFEDMPRIPCNVKRKVTAPVENAVLGLRTAFNWGTQRIKTVLECPPPYLVEFLASLGLETPIKLSRQTINNVLKKHKMNGSPYGKLHEWKFFTASKPNELWQFDLKGPINMNGKRFFILVVIDDHSRFLMLVKVYEGDPTSQQVISNLKECVEKYGKPEKILTDNGPQFKEAWKQELSNKRIQALFAHPYYPRDKGKIERSIRNINEELIRVAKYFGTRIEKISNQFKDWYNQKRYHQGIKGYPAQIYAKNISTSS